MKQYLPLLFIFISLVLFSVALIKPSTVFAFCEFGYCAVGEPNDGCPYNQNFQVQEVCSVQPPQNGACCAGPQPSPSPPPPPPPPTPPPTPTPAPTCIQQPGSLASYLGCTSCNADTYSYYNCNGSTFQITYPNSGCSYLCPIPKSN